MRRTLELSYELLAQLARGAAGVAPRGSSKLARAMHARRGIRARFRAWGTQRRDGARPLVWLHATSVGEGLQARPILERLREGRPDVQLAYTFFSPSAEAFARSLRVDFCDYLPFDTAGDAGVALDSLRPAALVFSKLDVWPALTRAASSRKVRLGLISATMSAGSSRRWPFARALLRAAYNSLDAVGAIDDAHAARLMDVGVRPASIVVTGDTRYDQVWERAQRADRAGPLLGPFDDARPTIVAGSTWPADESQLLTAFLGARAGVPDLRLIVAPHEPTAEHMARITAWAQRERVTLARLDSPDVADADVILVDRLGVLGDLYALADIAFVGGGFHGSGLHSVLEPAAFGAPVVFGPRYRESRDAVLLIREGGGVSVSGAAPLAAQIRAWLAERPIGLRAGESAQKVVRSGLGAADRSYALIEGLLR